MRLTEFALLTDENIDPVVVQTIRSLGFDVRDVCEEGLQGATDLTLIREAFADDRVIVTHDSDFGTLAIRDGESIVGIVFLRPGHINSIFTVQTIKTLLAQDLEVDPPFLLVARRTGLDVAIRYRPL